MISESQSKESAITQIDDKLNIAKVAQSKERVFFPNLDGLRFFCFLSVFFFHSFATDIISIRENQLYRYVKYFLAGNGNLGVNFFFVLSGFLITYLLIIEKDRFVKIDIKSFYMRRVLRIWPLFYFCVFFGFVIFPIIKSSFGQIPNETANWQYYLIFVNNFDFLKNGLPDASVLGVLWSVAIEEQFYLCWPLIIAFTPRQKYFVVLICIVLISFLFRLDNVYNGDILENHTLSCISDMTIGGLSAIGIYYVKGFKKFIENISSLTIIVLYALVGIVFLFRKEIFWWSDVLHAADRIIISLLFSFVILEQNYSVNSLFKMSKLKWISKWGTYTYGLYCLHMIGILIAATVLKKLGWNKNVYQVIFLEGGLSLVLTMGIAYISFKYYESWFLKFKDKFSRISK